MKNAFLINAHQAYPFSAGRLNRTLVDQAAAQLRDFGYDLRTTSMEDEWDVDAEIEKHLWADVVLLQTPVNWMGVPWSFKKYMDEVYSAGMDGRLCEGDGRTRADGSKQYGSGGALDGTKYLLSLTFNAPRESFEDESQRFFGGRSVDELFWPTHLNFKFFGMEPLPTFACHDVMKNPNVEDDLERFAAHLERHFPKVQADAGA